MGEVDTRCITTDLFVHRAPLVDLPLLLSCHQVVGSEVTADGVKLSLEGAKGGSAETFDAEVVLVAIGRRPFTKNIGLEEVVRIHTYLHTEKVKDQPTGGVHGRKGSTHVIGKGRQLSSCKGRPLSLSRHSVIRHCPTLPYLFC